MLERKVSGRFEHFVLIFVFILTTRKASGVTQHPVADILCDDEAWIDDIIKKNFCIDSRGDISLVDDEQLICDSLHVPLEEENMIHRVAKPCSPNIARPIAVKRKCEKRKVQPPKSQKKSMCKDGEKLRVQKTGSAKPCIAKKAIPAFVEVHVDVPECAESTTAGPQTSTSIDNPMPAMINRAVAPCADIWKVRYNNADSLCSLEERLYVWNVPSLGRLCRVESAENVQFQIRQCPPGARQLMNEIIALAARKVHYYKIPECSKIKCSKLRTHHSYTLCFFDGTYYLWKPPFSVFRAHINPAKFDYCTIDAVRVMQMVGGTDAADGESIDVTKTFIVCSDYMLRKTYSSEDDRCVYEGWLFLWKKTEEVLCIIRAQKKEDEKRAACSMGAVADIGKVKEISREPIHAPFLKECSEHVMKNGRSLGYRTCFFKGLYLEVIQKNDRHACRRDNSGRELLQGQYCFKDELEVVKETITALLLGKAPPAPHESYKVTMEVMKRPAPAGDDSGVHPQSKHFKQSIKDMVNASCPPGGFVDMRGYTVKVKQSITKLSKRYAEFVPGTHVSPVLAKMRQSRQLEDGYRIEFVVLVRQDVEKKKKFSQVALLVNLKQRSRTFDGGAYIVDSNSIKVHKVTDEPPDGAWRRRATWIVAGVTCAALVLLSIIFISSNIRSRRMDIRSRRDKRKRNIFLSFS